jgi:hypothetical protein
MQKIKKYTEMNIILPIMAILSLLLQQNHHYIPEVGCGKVYERHMAENAAHYSLSSH